MRILIFATFMFTLCMFVGCKEESPGAGSKPLLKEQDSGGDLKPVTSGNRQQKASAVATSEAKAKPPINPKRTPPAPPLLESFQETPQIRLFPWVGDFRPAFADDQQTHWKNLVEQLVNGTSIAEDQTTGSRGWVFSGIEASSSSGYFSPLKVEPKTTYQVLFKLTADLQKGSAAGIRIIEFDEFLWVGEQYTEKQYKTHHRGGHSGIRLTGKVSGRQSFTFTTGPDTHMIHLVLFREGTHARDRIMFDDIQITVTEGH